MAVTKVGIVYSVADGLIASVTVPDDDVFLPNILAGDGQAVVMMPIEEYQAQTDADSLQQALLSIISAG